MSDMPTSNSHPNVNMHLNNNMIKLLQEISIPYAPYRTYHTWHRYFEMIGMCVHRLSIRPMLNEIKTKMYNICIGLYLYRTKIVFITNLPLLFLL